LPSQPFAILNVKMEDVWSLTDVTVQKDGVELHVMKVYCMPATLEQFK